MIIRSLLFTLILLVGYAGWLWQHKNASQPGQHQWQDNVIKAQEYLYGTEHNNLKVIIGSSLSCRLLMDSMPPNYYNLSFGGQSLFDGLKIVEKANQKPTMVFIEMNLVKKSGDTGFTNSLFVPLVYELREKINFLQEKNQPLSFAGNFLAPKIGHSILDPFTGRFWNPLLKKFHADKVLSTTADINFYNRMVQQQVQQFSIPFEEKLIRKNFKELQNQVTVLSKSGVRVVFFEMPMHPALENTVQMKNERQLFEEYFPPDSFNYIQKPIYADYKTTDGVHLAGDNALKFTRHFLQFAP